MFAGVRIKESSKNDLCVLTLGNIYATSLDHESGLAGKNWDWVDTGFVLALNTASGDPFKLYLIYKYEVYDVEYLDGGAEKRDEEPEQEEPPKFCEGPDAFTVAVLESPVLESPVLESLVRNMTKTQYVNSLSSGLNTDLRLSVLSTKKPDLTIAGYKDADHPYVPVFPSRDD